MEFGTSSGRKWEGGEEEEGGREIQLESNGFIEEKWPN